MKVLASILFFTSVLSFSQNAERLNNNEEMMHTNQTDEISYGVTAPVDSNEVKNDHLTHEEDWFRQSADRLGFFGDIILIVRDALPNFTLGFGIVSHLIISLAWH